MRAWAGGWPEGFNESWLKNCLPVTEATQLFEKCGSWASSKTSIQTFLNTVGRAMSGVISNHLVGKNSCYLLLCALVAQRYRSLHLLSFKMSLLIHGQKAFRAHASIFRHCNLGVGDTSARKKQPGNSANGRLTTNTCSLVYFIANEFFLQPFMYNWCRSREQPAKSRSTNKGQSPLYARKVRAFR